MLLYRVKGRLGKIWHLSAPNDDLLAENTATQKMSSISNNKLNIDDIIKLVLDFVL